jgi:hypothetical protein
MSDLCADLIITICSYKFFNKMETSLLVLRLFCLSIALSTFIIGFIERYTISIFIDQAFGYRVAVILSVFMKYVEIIDRTGLYIQGCSIVYSVTILTLCMMIDELLFILTILLNIIFIVGASIILYMTYIFFYVGSMSSAFAAGILGITYMTEIWNLIAIHSSDIVSSTIASISEFP